MIALAVAIATLVAPAPADARAGGTSDTTLAPGTTAPPDTTIAPSTTNPPSTTVPSDTTIPPDSTVPPDTTTPPSATPDTTVVPPTTAVPATPPVPKVRGVGDSVFHSAESRVVARLEPEYRPRFESVLGASIQDMTPAATRMAANGPAAMVIGLGNPDVETMAGAYGFVVYQWADTLLRRVRDVPCVVWVNLKQRGVNSYYTPRWEQASTTFNQWLVGAATPGRLYFPNLHVLDWNAATVGHPGWFLADGLHLNETGQANYARKIDRFLNRVCPP